MKVMLALKSPERVTGCHTELPILRNTSHLPAEWTNISGLWVNGSSEEILDLELSSHSPRPLWNLNGLLERWLD